ncbi:unnamed protein product [Mytilus edulis]|uniref:Uncharacterized protein n=1 Tax=Mytilus edulis TaxID=6550 RepID=A0A8S3TRK6_MYTED|nr:unnamed protein product [Mytilus edulis]
MSNIKPYPSTKPQTMSNINKLIQVLYSKTMSNIKTIQVLHSNNVKYQNLSKYYTKHLLKQCQTPINIKTYPSTLYAKHQNVKHQNFHWKFYSNNVKHQNLSKYFTKNNVKHQNLFKYFTQTMSNIKTYPSTLLKQCQTSKLIQVLYSNNVKHQTLSKVLHSNNVKHKTYPSTTLKTMSNIKTPSKYYTQTMSNIKTYPGITLNNVNIKPYPSTTLKQCQ